MLLGRSRAKAVRFEDCVVSIGPEMEGTLVPVFDAWRIGALRR